MPQKDTTARERKARERDSKREQGLKRLELWVKPEHHQTFKLLEQSFQEKDKKEGRNT